MFALKNNRQQGLWEGGSDGTSVRGPDTQEGDVNLWMAS